MVYLTLADSLSQACLSRAWSAVSLPSFWVDWTHVSTCLLCTSNCTRQRLNVWVKERASEWMNERTTGNSIIKILNIQIMPNVMLIVERQQDNTTCPKMTKQEKGRKRSMPKAEKEFKQPNCTCMYSCNNGLQFSTFSLPMRSLLELWFFWIWNISVGATDVASLVCSAHDYESNESSQL